MASSRTFLLAFLLAGCALDRTGIGGPGRDDGSIEPAPDSGVLDAGEADGGEEDASVPDGGELDAGEPDGGELDAGFDAGEPDAGPPDAGPPDAGGDSGPPLEHCDRVTLESVVYLFCPFDATRDVARARCMAEGMDLAVIGGSGENDALTGEVDRRSGTWMIGLDDTADEGTFVWVDGSSPGFTRWGTFQPDNFSGEDCVELRDNGRWNDIDCNDDRRHFICE